jgi:hypothetical protein
METSPASMRLTVAVAGKALRAAQAPHAAGSKDRFASGICRPKQRHHRDIKSGGQMQRSGISADEEHRAPGDCRQPRQRSLQQPRPGSHRDDLARQGLFPRTKVYQGNDVARVEPARHFGITLRGPLFSSPSGAGIDDRDAVAVDAVDLFAGPILGVRVEGEDESRGLVYRDCGE